MAIYYCDGSLSNQYKKIGIGIFYNGTEEYAEMVAHNWKSQLHEIEAMIKTIEIADRKEQVNFKIVNDDKWLVTTINSMLSKRKVKSKGLIQKERFNHLLELIKSKNVTVSLPKTEEEKNCIRICHKLSRTYMI